ncbi:MAG: GTP cyclohydrolase II [Calditrichia bacterium]
MVSNTHTPQYDEFSSVAELIEAYKRGEVLILVDDEDRENEGDFIVASEHATPEAINFMAKEGRGLICVSITEKRAAALDLSPMSQENTALLGTPFTMSVDAIENTTTGISAFDRAITISKMIAADTSPTELARPGHVFPLVADSNGVLARPGHTEAVVDLAKLSNLNPSGVLCEILSEDGTMARLPELHRIAQKHGLKIGHIKDIISYRQSNEKLIELESRVDLPTKHGNFELLLFRSLVDPDETHLALLKDGWKESDSVLTRIHSECLTGDVFGSGRCDCGQQLETAMKAIHDNGSGIILYMHQEGRGIGLAEKLKAYALQEQGIDTVDANLKLGFAADAREYWFAVQILRHLGVRSVDLITNNPEKINQLEKQHIHVASRVPSLVEAGMNNVEYLRTKQSRMGHLLNGLATKTRSS